MTTVLLVVFFVTMLASVPIVISIIGSSIISLELFGNITKHFIASQIFGAMGSFTLIALPFFMLAGNLMLKGGISERLVTFCEALLGRRTGAMGLVAITACMIFAAISGSGPAAVAAMGMIMLPIMKEHKYDMGYAASLVATAGGLGIIIPPSLPMISYCLMADISVGAMFMSGIIPGIMIGVACMILNYFVAKKKGFGKARERKLTFKEFMKAIKESILALLMPIIILGGIYGGIFTATEASCVAVVYGLIVGVFVYKKITWKVFKEMLFDSAKSSGGMMMIFAVCNAFNWVLTIQQIPTKLTNFITSTFTTATSFLWALIILLLILGCFMAVNAAIIILTPLLVPIAHAYGFSLIQLGIIMIVCLNVGGITPPFGVQMFITSSISETPVEKMFKWIFLFVVLNVIILIPLVAFPEISLWLPRIMGFTIS